MTELKTNLRPVSANDLEQISVLDEQVSGESRRGFFEKRLKLQAQEPNAFISLAAISSNKLAGFLFAQLLDGEFGRNEPVAVLDAIGVDPDQQGKSIGRQLIAELDRIMEQRGVATLHTQANWNQPGLAEFFSSVGFELAPRLVLERPAERVEF